MPKAVPDTGATSAKQERIKQWVLSQAPEVGDVGLDEDLIENRILDSLKIMNFIFFLEELIEREIPVNESSVQHLRTLRSVYRHFVEAAAGDRR